MKFFIKYFYEMKRYQTMFLQEKLNYDIGRSEYLHLVALTHSRGKSQEFLSKEIGFDKATTTKAIKSLIDKGFITRVKNPLDRRAYIVDVTENGKEVIKKIYDINEEWNSSIIKNIDEDDFDIFLRVLEKIKDNAKNITED